LGPLLGKHLDMHFYHTRAVRLIHLYSQVIMIELFFATKLCQQIILELSSF